MATKVFINYRREDSASDAGRINDRLERELGRESLFIDVDTIPYGMDFVEVLGVGVAKCDVLLAIIGSRWLEALNRRLDSEDDFVRIEIAAALKRNIPVIPILLDGAPMPKAERLPDDLKALARRHALDVRYASFHADMEKLVRRLRGTSAPTPAPPAARSRDDEWRAEGRMKIDAPIFHGAPGGWFLPGAGNLEWFKDHELGPEMVVVPAGEFIMGSSPFEIAALKEYSDCRCEREGPRRVVTISAPFAAGRCAVTFDEWDACVAEGGCKGKDPGLGRGRRPVVAVSWKEAQAYVAWLSRKTGKTYRLLTEAEWEYVARAGTTSAFWWGDTISTTQANYNGNCTFRGSAKGEYRQVTVPVDSFQPNPWGLYNVHGNVWEWVEDTWRSDYKGAPADGSAWVQRNCDGVPRGMRGGSYQVGPGFLRAAYRGYYPTANDDAAPSLGFRVARTFTP
jgi:formylglycine-generating enzyme required for sulfatase activity